MELCCKISISQITAQGRLGTPHACPAPKPSEETVAFQSYCMHPQVTVSKEKHFMVYLVQAAFQCSCNSLLVFIRVSAPARLRNSFAEGFVHEVSPTDRFKRNLPVRERYKCRMSRWKPAFLLHIVLNILYNGSLLYCALYKMKFRRNLSVTHLSSFWSIKNFLLSTHCILNRPIRSYQCYYSQNTSRYDVEIQTLITPHCYWHRSKSSHVDMNWKKIQFTKNKNRLLHSSKDQ